MEMAKAESQSFASDQDGLSVGSSSPEFASESGNETQSTGSDQKSRGSLLSKENRATTISRIVVLFVLLLATCVTSYFVYALARDSEQEAYEAAFYNLAEKLTNSIISDTSLKFWMARTVSDATAMMLKATNTTALNLFIPQEDWENISREARFHGNVNLVSWNPLLRNDDDRMSFETFAQNQTFLVGAEPVCFVCGTADRGYTNPDDLVEIEGFGVFKCAQIENSGRQGVIPFENCGWITEVTEVSCTCGDLPPGAEVVDNKVDFPDKIFKLDDVEGSVSEPYNNPPYLPTWTSSVIEILQLPIMFNHMSEPYSRKSVDEILRTSFPVMSETIFRNGLYYENYAGFENEVSSMLSFPVLIEGEIVGTVSFDLRWSTFYTFVFPQQSEFIDLVIENSCGQNFTFTVDPDADILVFKGEGDLHADGYDDLVYSSTFEEFDMVVRGAAPVVPDEDSTFNYCSYRYHVFTSQRLYDQYISQQPLNNALYTAAIFVCTSLVFIIYDFFLYRQKKKIVASANRADAIVSSLFPKNVRDRLFEQAAEGKNGSNTYTPKASKHQIETFVSGGKDVLGMTTEPIADLFASATVMFLDIAGFTAWSSEREPSQVFLLLETIYQAFDRIARKLGVFKVETIGDSYVAVCGLPTIRDDHAIVMVRFADKCLAAMAKVTTDLEVQLGPSTCDLRARVGLHSGPVTAGVLRGEKARFQLFGDTVNIASRIENSGRPGRIHTSSKTVDLLVKAGKNDWVQKRDDLVHIKGKGEVQTFYVTSKSAQAESTEEEDEDELNNSRGSGMDLSRHLESITEGGDATSRLIEWNVEVLSVHLQRIVAFRLHDENTNLQEMVKAEEALVDRKDGKLVLDQMTEYLSLPCICRNTSASANKRKLDPIVKSQLRDFVTRIAKLYRNVPFHNFEHASHVLMSASKLMKRIVVPDHVDYKQQDDRVAIDIHVSTYGISSDPILQFAAVFSALIHDADHTGMTNAELVALKSPAAIAYRNKTVAEQNSVDLAWAILMETNFKELRSCIYKSEAELKHFRQLVVNSVMATDIADKELKQYREQRWAAAFPQDEDVSQLFQIDRDRKATIVFEYIIQASDVCHTMQHWLTYQKFNKRLFEERYVAWLNGHMEKEPSLGWYGGEIWFFDNYIIPLAQKLDKCGVFGVSYYEYLAYAIENRSEWEKKGKEIVAEMKAECDAKYAVQLEEKLGVSESFV